MSIASNLVRKARYLMRGGLWLRIIRRFSNPTTVFMGIVKGGPGELLLKTRSGLRIWVRNNVVDTLIVKEIYVDQPYHPSIKLPQAPVVVDIGGYIGDFTLQMAHECNARVFTCEPVPENYEILLKNVRENGLEDRVKVYHAGAGYGEAMTLQIARHGREIHASANMFAGPEQLTIALISPEAILRDNALDHIDLLKIDCEGMEYELIARMADATLRAVRYMVFEWHQIENYQELLGQALDKLAQLGYTLRQEDKIYHAINTSFAPIVPAPAGA